MRAGKLALVVGMSLLVYNEVQKWSKDYLPKVRPWWSLIKQAADRHGISRHTLAGLLWQESRFDPDAIGSSGEIGMGQITEAAAQDIGIELDTIKSDPALQIDAAARFLALQLHRADGDPWLALRAYNGGFRGARLNPLLSVTYAGNVLQAALADKLLLLFGGPGADGV